MRYFIIFYYVINSYWVQEPYDIEPVFVSDTLMHYELIMGEAETIIFIEGLSNRGGHFDECAEISDNLYRALHNIEYSKTSFIK